MVKRLLMSTLVLAFILMVFTEDYYITRCFASEEAQSEPSSYAGQYKGNWTGKSSASAEQKGTWSLKVDANGKVTGKEVNETAGRTAELSGSVNEDGDIKLIIEYPNLTFAIKGTVVITKSGHLKGTLTQFEGREMIWTIQIDLPPQKSASNDEVPMGAQTKQEQFDASTLVGTWDGEVTESGYPQKITWQINADGTSIAWITSRYGTSLLGRPGSKWRYSDGIIYGDASSATLTWIDRNHIMLTIIQNEDGPSSRGRTRHYYRRPK